MTIENTKDTAITDDELDIDLRKEKVWYDDGEHTYPITTVVINGVRIREDDARDLGYEIRKLLDEDE